MFAVAMCDVQIVALEVDDTDIAASYAEVRWLQPRQRAELRGTTRLLARKLHRFEEAMRKKELEELQEGQEVLARSVADGIW
jgi:hypothetical protein